MSTSMLYHAFGIKHVKYLKTEYLVGEVRIHAEMTRKLAVCPVCRSGEVIYQGPKVRQLRLVPIGLHQTWLHLIVHRLQCRRCGALAWPRLPFAGPRFSYSSSFERLVIELLRFTTISSGKIEGLNNKIKTLKRQAYGYRDLAYFKLRLFHLHEQTYSLTG